MRIAGLPKRINSQIEQIPRVQEYFEELAKPEEQRAPDLDHLLDGIEDARLRDIIVHIGQYNELPQTYEPRKITNGDSAHAYRKYASRGWTDLSFLMDTVRDEFMLDFDPSKIMFRRQVALLCTGCGEYKASGMFKFESKDQSYTRQIDFGTEHVIDPETTEFRIHRTHKKQKVKRLFCKTCNTAGKGMFERRYNGPYASAREYVYDPKHLLSLKKDGLELPKVVGVRVRTKESASDAEKMAYMLSGKAPSGAQHFRIMQENKDRLAKELGEDTLDRLVEEAIYDKFGIRLIASSEDNCYVMRDWFRQYFYVFREIDYIRGPPGPKENGYQSIHMTIMGLPTDPFTRQDGIKIPVDVQIRTMEMDKQAESGTAAWGDYKKRRDTINHQFLLAVTAFRHYLFGV